MPIIILLLFKTEFTTYEKKPPVYWIEKLSLIEHSEGGYYREIYRSSETIAAEHLPDRYDGSRAFSTSIYSLLEGNDFSAFHSLRSDEIWHFYTGRLLGITPGDSWLGIFFKR